MSIAMYVPAPDKSLIRRILRRGAWFVGDGLAALLSSIQDMRLPDEPLQPFLQKLPMLLGLYERDTVELIRKLVKPGMIVVDGGAHAGYFTRIFSRLVGPTGSVLAFEIHPDTLQLLRYNTRSLANVEIIPAALGAQDGVATLYKSKDLSSGHSATPTKPGLKAGGTIPMRSLSSVIAERGLTRVDFVKLDIEGGEPAIMRSVPDGDLTVLFEVKRYILESAGEIPESFLAEIIDQGFSVWRVGSEQIHSQMLQDRMDCLDKANILAIRRNPS